MFKLNVFLIRFLPYLYTARIWLNLITSKAFRSSRSQMFYKIGVLKNFAKFTGKHLCWSHFLMKLHMCFPMIFVESQEDLCFNHPSKLAKKHDRYSLTWVHCYFTKHFSELSYHFLFQSSKVVF